MQTALSIISVICSILLIGVVLVQKSKGGGLASSFAGANQILGVRRGNSFIERATWILAIVICFCALLSGIADRGSNNAGQEIMVKDVAPTEQTALPFDTPTDETVVTEETVATDGNNDVTVVESTEAVATDDAAQEGAN